MEILDAAIVEIDNVGPAALRIKRVAEHADVSPALIFHHFQTRDGLIGEAMRRRFQKMAASRSIDKLHEFEKAVEKYDLMEALTSVGARSIFHTPSDIRWGWLEAIAEARTNVIVREVVEEAYTLIGEVIADLLNTGTRDGAISPLVDPRILSSIWNSAAFGITISEVATSGGVSFEDWANVLRISFATLLGVEDGVRA
jgi:AcrR family transcriptional regulator